MAILETCDTNKIQNLVSYMTASKSSAGIEHVQMHLYGQQSLWFLVQIHLMEAYRIIKI